MTVSTITSPTTHAITPCRAPAPGTWAARRAGRLGLMAAPRAAWLLRGTPVGCAEINRGKIQVCELCAFSPVPWSFLG